MDKFLQHDDTYEAYEDDIDIVEHLLHGPFNWAPPRSVDNRSYVIGKVNWSALVAAANPRNVDISDLGKIKPLR